MRLPNRATRDMVLGFGAGGPKVGWFGWFGWPESWYCIVLAAAFTKYVLLLLQPSTVVLSVLACCRCCYCCIHQTNVSCPRAEPTLLYSPGGCLLLVGLLLLLLLLLRLLLLAHSAHSATLAVLPRSKRSALAIPRRSSVPTNEYEYEYILQSRIDLPVGP